MKNSIVLFDCDLRIEDNPAFFEAAKNSQKLLPVFILDEKNKRPVGAASKWFLHFALQNFSQILEKKYKLKLLLKKGDSLEILSKIFSQEKFDAIYFSKSVEPYNIKLHNLIKKLAEKNSIEVFEFLSQTLFDPAKLKNSSKSYFKIFTPFWRHCLKNSNNITKPLSEPKFKPQAISIKISDDDLKLLPEKKWAKKFEKIWKFNNDKITENFFIFLEKNIHKYKQARNFPALEATSIMSPYLHFGLISVRQIFDISTKVEPSEGSTQFIASLGWREFCHHLLFHFPELPQKSFNPRFEKFPWQKNSVALKKWQNGKTGFPIVDAGMRELWATGFMHNRVRMIVASFLIKDLLIDWREGEKWFWDCLVDADLANNSGSWQWVAGSGADAAPYFRVFSPVLQSERFDKNGEYIRKWIPEIAKLPNRFIRAPWEASEKILESCGIKLGKNYPKPIIDHSLARDMAIMLYKTL